MFNVKKILLQLKKKIIIVQSLWFLINGHGYIIVALNCYESIYWQLYLFA